MEFNGKELTGKSEEEIAEMAIQTWKTDPKIRALDNFVIGDISQSELDIIKKKLLDITQAETELQELLEATQRAKESLIKAIPDFNNVLSVAERDIWTAIYEAIKKDIQVAVGDLWLKAYAAKLETGSASY